ncbi:hypothetical protein SBRCBS47491_001114 [Sporothrix bragantina]|uniref:Gfo/Idh/MocA-like oxidoreductase N-terminal domain-containing protein n=1 Tax=Sporothrix bragantina TaxID=671064 RepID=A0ABP0AVX1_9PEZI
MAIDATEQAKPVTISIIGAGHRGRTYADYAFYNPDLAKVVAVAEPSKHRRAVMSSKHEVPLDMQFRSWQDMMAVGKIADCVVIAVQDQLHAAAVADAAAPGYHILCDKPMATSIAECVAMVKQHSAH